MCVSVCVKDAQRAVGIIFECLFIFWRCLQLGQAGSTQLHRGVRDDKYKKHLKGSWVRQFMPNMSN